MDVENNSVLKSVIYELEAIKSEIRTVKLDSYKQGVAIEGLNAEILTLKSENKKQELEIESLRNQSCQSNNFVSFMAVTSTDRAYASGESIVFDKVLRNYGKAYDGNGVFTCPVTG